MYNKIIKVYSHNKYFYYFNNKNNKIYFNKSHEIKIIFNNTEK